ncbi:MAG: CoA transferase [Firmicutes bacterium]|nr:CoA transferase [Bacillota bacterium]
MGALSSLKILDFSTLLPGPLATMFLADLGADVISVSAPGKPDLMNFFPPIIDELGVSASFAWLGRNKRSMELNLKNPAAVAAVKKLVKEYDIVVEQFRPGVMKRLGLDYETLKQENPALIYCSISGYGQTGPMAMKPGHDINYVALSGNMLMMDGKTPQKVSIPNFHLADIAGGGYMSAMAILAAVHYRDMTGKGQYLDMSMMDSILPFACIEGAGVLAARKYPQGWQGLTVSGTQNGPHYDVYETKDHKYMSVGALEPKFFAALCQTLGLPEWMDGKIIKKDPELMRETFRAKFLEKTRAEWTQLFRTVDACVEPVYDISEMVETEQVKAREMVVSVPLATQEEKTVEQIANPIKMSETPAQYKHTAYPTGYSTQEVLKWIGLTDQEIEEVMK